MDDAAKRLIFERNGVAAPRPSRTGFSGSMSDPVARQIIAARNGLGSSPQITPEDAQRLAAMRTNRQARSVLGAVAQTLQTAYAKHLPALARATSAGRDLQATMKSRLDTVNNYAQRVYAGIPDDDAPVSDLNHRKVSLTVAQARDAAQDIDAAVASQRLDVGQGLADVLTYLIEHALGAVGGALLRNLPGAGALPKWVKIVVGGVVVVVAVGVVARLVRTIMLGRAQLGEAEEAAIAIAEAQRRKRRTKSVLSIS